MKIFKFFFTLLTILSAGFINNLKASDMKDFIEKTFQDVIENMQADEEIISQYFSSDYIQYVDGHMLDYPGFIQHMKKQKTLINSAKVTIDHFVADANKICTVHRVDIQKKNDEKISVKVIAYFEIENGKIILCDELTKLLQGGEEDHNIGSTK